LNQELYKDLLSLDLDAEITLFQLSNFDPSNLSDTFNFCAYSGVSFGGITYNPLSCEVEGIKYSSDGGLPRPKLKVVDVGSLVSGLIYLYGGIEGATVTIRKTLKRFLDGEITADPTAEKPRDIFVVSQITNLVPGAIVEIELSASFDFIDETVPRRMAARTCPWKYRGVECGWTGRYFDINNRPTLDSKLDVCSKSIDACQKRFGKNAPLPFGGFVTLTRK
jgi:lambda family phage minor tail protein L